LTTPQLLYRVIIHFAGKLKGKFAADKVHFLSINNDKFSAFY
jgi:hypothetical protein